MCRNIKPLYNLEPPVTEDEIQLAAVQFLRKITAINKPSKVNEAAFNAAVTEITAVSSHLLASLETSAKPKSREELAAIAIQRSAARFGTRQTS